MYTQQANSLSDDDNHSSMGCCGSLAKCFLYLVVPVMTGVLLVCHLECEREREQYLSDKFQPHYQPDLTDCSAELSFVTPTDSVYYEAGQSVGNNFSRISLP